MGSILRVLTESVDGLARATSVSKPPGDLLRGRLEVCEGSLETFKVMLLELCL